MKKLCPAIFFILFYVFGIFCARGITAGEPLVLWYKQPALNWEKEALPIGNGFMGGMLFGGTSKETIQFNVDSLWTGDEKETGRYQDFGYLFISFDDKSDPQNYKRELDIERGVHRVRYIKNNYGIEQVSFASHPAGIIAWHLSSKNPNGLSGRIILQGTHGEKTAGAEPGEGLPGAGLEISGHLENGLKYFARIVVLNKGGKVGNDRSLLPGKKNRTKSRKKTAKKTIPVNTLRFEDVRELTILLGADTNYLPDYKKKWRGKDPEQKVVPRIKAASKKTFKSLYAEHVLDYQGLFNRFSLILPESGNEQGILPTDKRIAAYKGNDPGLETLLLQYGRYLLISCSRPDSLPANLQGVWNHSNNPPWRSDYHSNINVQMNYWLAEPTGLPECHQAFLNYVLSQIPIKRISTKKEYGEDIHGWTLRTENGIYGGGSWKWNTPASAWYAQHFWEHYAFGLDREYLRKTAYPVLKEVCRFWEDRLKKLGDGTLVVPDGWSPEHGPVEDGASYDQEIVYDLFTNYIDASSALGIDESYRNRVAAMRSHLLVPKIGRWGQLQEWAVDRDNPNDHHRHVSHLFAVYPGRQIDPVTTPKLAKAAAVSLKARGFGGTGWSRAWKISFWARLLRADYAYTMIQNLIDGQIYPNGFDTHPPFQIDGNFGYCAGVVEMLLQSHEGYIHLLPAIPKEWQEGEVRGIRARGDFTLNIKWKNGRLLSVTILSGAGEKCILRYAGKTVTLKTEAGKEYKVKATDFK